MTTTKAAERLKELTRPTGEEDVMRVEYPEARLTVTPRQAGVAVAVVAALVIGWFLLRDGPSSAESLEPQWSASETEEGASPETIVVSVVGAVANPGLVTLDNGARVADALEQASPLPEADTMTLNLAQLLVDGQQIHVLAHGESPPLPPAGDPAGGPGGAGSGSDSGGGISLNSASAGELTELPGVGEATAAAIVAHREANGPFTAVEQLMDVKGIGPAKFDAVKDLVTL
ncbi:ComEA family DNA-binding protein [Corynebacterium genitalium ATCC 33030]|uniref:ComEA protein n=1 Tax=Corynebacterium genitalium ATCC 33030 TaxID=585529 RepID=D7WC89_9CORY|nr:MULTISPECIES: ComEA family DNA-binding protein [Corynebacterium]MCQ4618415.1 ComEA family DNA-binding protein [Corynebacterium pseudogenitalium]EFK54718.1 comEA protein [Corynebacterium genitalium ATCC 33030]MCQ4621074.1 ComEA family DNA-binding protein [Corynebacterium sp. CCUG 71335]MCQ4625463.1 ComEA family DNA-binding protein [Corynebacterium sp. CCUG 69979]MCQ4627790.1 ComEA family DNA-binding protein [Corynebacterium sp. CCUG 65737]